MKEARKAREKRSLIMSAVKTKNTAPEIEARRILHALGLRFRIHRRDLPGTPDIVLPKYQTAIFVHGCFWHRHPNCKHATMPKTRQDFWARKFSANLDRDRRNQEMLQSNGWRVLIIWECDLKDRQSLTQRLGRAFGLDQPGNSLPPPKRLIRQA